MVLVVEVGVVMCDTGVTLQALAIAGWMPAAAATLVPKTLWFWGFGVFMV